MASVQFISCRTPPPLSFIVGKVAPYGRAVPCPSWVLMGKRLGRYHREFFCSRRLPVKRNGCCFFPLKIVNLERIPARFTNIHCNLLGNPVDVNIRVFENDPAANPHTDPIVGQCLERVSTDFCQPDLTRDDHTDESDLTTVENHRTAELVVEKSNGLAVSADVFDGVTCREFIDVPSHEWIEIHDGQTGLQGFCGWSLAGGRQF